MKNTHVKILLLIVVLFAAAIWTIMTQPTRMGLDIQGGIRVVLRAKAEELQTKQLEKGQLDTITRIMRNRVDALGVAEPVVYPKPPDQIVVEFPGLTNKEQALAVIQTTARLEFRSVPALDNGRWRTEAEFDTHGQPTGYEVLLGPDGKPVPPSVLAETVFSTAPVLSGDDLLPNTRVAINQQGYEVAFEFRGDKDVFERFTRTHDHKRLAIFLDKKLLSAPVIDGIIPGKGVIRGHFTAEQDKMLSSQLNAGALPVSLEQVELRNVEATAGTRGDPEDPGGGYRWPGVCVAHHALVVSVARSPGRYGAGALYGLHVRTLQTDPGDPHCARDRRVHPLYRHGSGRQHFDL